MRKIFMLIFLSTLAISIQAQTGEWWQSASIYQIYPRSFYDSDGDGIGDMEGIIQKLDYIKDLGYDAIWISPFFKSPQKDFGYDVSDYIGLATEYGHEGDAERLIKEAHQRNLKVIFDMVMNHTSIEHEWFKNSTDSTSDKSDWYIWKNGDGKDAPNNWKNMTGQVGWQYHPLRKQWYWSSFLPFQADLNWRNQAVKDTMFNTVRYWLDKGVDGFRLDIFNVLLEDSAFTPNPHGINYFPGPENPGGGFQRLRYNFNQPENYGIAKELRSVLNEYQGRYLLGEVDGKHEQIKGFLGENNNGLHSIFLFDLIYYEFSAKYFCETSKTFEKYYPAPYVPVYVYSNHDKRRSIGRIEKNQEKAKLLAVFQLTSRGIAVTYQGEEFGSSDMRIPLKEAKDPIAQYFHFPQFMVDRLPWLINRDECRTPMQWSAAENAGFSKPGTTTWLPINPEYKNINAQAQLNDSNSLLHTYKTLLKIRKEQPALHYGSSRIIENNKLPKALFIMERTYQSEKLFVFINFGGKDLEINNLIDAKQIIYTTHAGNKLSPMKIQLRPYSSIILK